MSTTPNMNLTLPAPSVTAGPLYAQQEVTAFQTVDLHDHSTGKGVQVGVNGLNINGDLAFNGNNLNSVRGLRLNGLVATPTGATDTRIVYSKGLELAYRDGAGNEVILTNAGSVAGVSGSISGLTSPASATFSAGTNTFLWQSNTNTPAKMSFSAFKIYEYGNTSANPITIQSPASLAAAYTLTLPAALPTAAGILQTDTSGNLSFQTAGLTPIGSVVATFPNLTGAYACAATTAADGSGYVLCQGQTIADATSPMNGVVVPNINNSVFLQGNTTSGTAGGSNTNSTLLAHTHGAGSFATSLSGTFAATGHTHNMAHYHQELYANNATLYGYSVANTNNGVFTNLTGGTNAVAANTGTQSGGSFFSMQVTLGGAAFYTSGALGQAGGSGSSAQTGTESADASLSGSNSVTGTSASTGTGSSYDSRPSYINAVYVMRIR